jgi:hypothetical protein
MHVGGVSYADPSYNTYPAIPANFWHLADKQVGLIAVVDKKKPVIVIY